MRNPVGLNTLQQTPFSLTPLTDDARAIQQSQNLYNQSQMQAKALEEQKRQQERAIAKQKEFETKFDAIIKTQGHNPKALISLSMQYPDMIGENLMKSVSEQEKQSLIKSASPIYFAAKNGKYDIAASKAREAAKAYEQYDPETSKLYTEFADSIESGDEGTRGIALDQAQMMLMGAMGIEDFKKAFDIRMKEKEFGLESGKTAAGIAETEAKVETEKQKKKKIEQEILKLQAEMKQYGKGGIPIEKRPEYELKLRNQYLKETDEFQLVSGAYDRILASKSDAAGDLALIFNYMKMLDPGSTVREGEFANAQNAAGVSDQVRNYWNKLQSGERLNKNQREMFKNQSKSLFEAGKSKEDRVRRRIKKQAEDYGLKVKNIFAKDSARVPSEVQVNSEQEASNYIDSLFVQ